MDRQQRAKTYSDRRDWTIQLLSGIKSPVVVEVGVHKADYGCITLDAVPDMIWYGIDPYKVYGRRLKQKHQKMFDDIFFRVSKKVARFGDRFILVRKSSEEAINYIPEKVHFVFIDGNHDYDYVLRDLELYEPKVMKGGIMAMHDYNTGPGIAINKYLESHEREIVHETFDPHGVCWWRM